MNSFFNVDSNQNDSEQKETTSDNIKLTFCRPQTAGSAMTVTEDDSKSEDDNASTTGPYETVNETKENQTTDVESKPLIISHIGKKSLLTEEMSPSNLDENESNKIFKRPKTSFPSRLSKSSNEIDSKKRPHSSYIAKNINQVSGGLIDIVNTQKEPLRVVYSPNKVVINGENNQDMGVIGKKFMHKNKREKSCCTLKEGYWKYELLNRG